MMDKIYYDDADINSNTKLIYAKGRNYRYAYKDSSCSIRYPSDELYQAYLDGAIIFIKASYFDHEGRSNFDEYLLPVAFKWINNVGYIGYAVRYLDVGADTYLGVFEGAPASIIDSGPAINTQD